MSIARADASKGVGVGDGNDFGLSTLSKEQRERPMPEIVRCFKAALIEHGTEVTDEFCVAVFKLVPDVDEAELTRELMLETLLFLAWQSSGGSSQGECDGPVPDERRGVPI